MELKSNIVESHSQNSVWGLEITEKTDELDFLNQIMVALSWIVTLHLLKVHVKSLYIYSIQLCATNLSSS